MADIAASQRKPASVPDAYLTSPLVILNNFGGNDPHIKLMAVMLQNLFPAINVTEVKLTSCRRVVMFHMDKATGEVEFRHYFIRAKGVGHSKQVKRVLKKKIQDLSKLDDIADVMEDDGYATSDSEGEEDENTHVTVPQDDKRGRRASSRQSAIRLQELGPRFRMKLIKIEDNVFDGDVIYHAYETKTPEEATKLRMLRKQRDRAREKRRSEQDANIQAKKAKLEAKGSRNSRGADRYEANKSSSDDEDVDLDVSGEDEDDENEDNEDEE